MGSRPVYVVASINELTAGLLSGRPADCAATVFAAGRPIELDLQKPPIVLIVAGESVEEMLTLAADIRRRDDPLAHAPIIAMGEPVAPDALIDGWVPLVPMPSDWQHLLDAWAPVDDTTLDRLGGIFGRTEIETLALRFRDLLVDALAIQHPADRVGIAHRIAGMAGTLGFAALSAAWNAAGDHTDAATHRLTRATIHALSLRAARAPRAAA